MRAHCVWGLFCIRSRLPSQSIILLSFIINQYVIGIKLYIIQEYKRRVKLDKINQFEQEIHKKFEQQHPIIIQERLMKIVTITLLILGTCLGRVECIQLQAKIKTEERYKSASIPSQQVYSISLERQSSTKQSQSQSCHTSQKQIVVRGEEEIYRLVQKAPGTNHTRAQSIYEKITTLDDDRNIIEEFELIGNETFLVTTDGMGYFLNPNYGTISVETQLNLNPSTSNTFFNIIIKNFKQRALIITSNGVSLCRSDQRSCVVLEPYEPLTYLFNAEIFTLDAITYLFLLTGDSVIIYEITAGNQLKNKVEYNSTFFGVDRIHARSIIQAKSNEILFLDARRGIISVIFDGKMSNFKTQKLVYDQPGCYQFTGNKHGDQVVMTCTLTAKSFFIQKLFRSSTSAESHYEAIETIFTNEKIYDTGFVDNFIMSRVYSGVRLYWTSNNMESPYPYDFNNAGNIFLHNALQSKIKVAENGENVIYISTEDEIRQFSLKATDPYVWCYSLFQISEQYKVTYSFPCANPTPMQRICTNQQELSYKSWEHGEVKITTMLIPLGLSLIGVFVIAMVVLKVHRKYKDDIERAKLKYSTENEFGM